ncbi:hypothetical protein FLL45_12260 [Aliikangiella marina]|uniref:ExoP galactose-binding-like domain-containing protein n=1 Tax=Aliikangiella marina TaxID=1712262 RepID=A0A545T8V2_9GAMM|nr:putative glycoside hydrolase [Aliikangiella marina]TQV73641.1 hypothetical protein FLL45_12260 [Aliikangiella marina]
MKKINSSFQSFLTVLTLLLVCSNSRAAEAQATKLTLMSGDAVSPYMLMVGDKGNWNLAVQGNQFQSQNGVVAVASDPETQIKTFDFKGKGEGQAYLQTNQPYDLSSFGEQNAALVLLMKVNKKPSKAVLLRMACGYPCQGEVDISKLLKKIPEDTWGKLSFSMSCFTERGLNIKNVMSPMALSTSGKFSITIAEASLVAGIGDKATFKC